MAARAKQEPHWKDEPDKHDYPAAADYLKLLMPSEDARAIVDQLQSAKLRYFKAKDLLRASGLPVLLVTNVHVAADLAKIRNGKLLSPVLLVRGSARAAVPLIIADGYHRVCASYSVDENADVPCRLADLP